MKVYLLRHGQTAYNAQKRYQGQLDIPLSAQGLAELQKADLSPQTVYVSPLCRARQTAAVLFPDAVQVPVDGLKEMCFGSFEGRNYKEMERDPEYLSWVQANCETACPDGERREEFCARSCAAFAGLLDAAFVQGQTQLVIVAHGGTQMAVMERFALPRCDYYHWCAPNGGGYLLDAAEWQKRRLLRLLGTVQYTKHAGEGAV